MIHIKKALAILKKIEDPVNVVTILISMGNLYFDMKDYKKGTQSFLDAEKLVNDFEQQTGNKHTSYENIQSIMTQLRDAANKED